MPRYRITLAHGKSTLTQTLEARSHDAIYSLFERISHITPHRIAHIHHQSYEESTLPTEQYALHITIKNDRERYNVLHIPTPKSNVTEGDVLRVVRAVRLGGLPAHLVHYSIQRTPTYSPEPPSLHVAFRTQYRTRHEQYESPTPDALYTALHAISDAIIHEVSEVVYTGVRTNTCTPSDAMTLTFGTSRACHSLRIPQAKVIPFTELEQAVKSTVRVHGEPPHTLQLKSG
jgi:hypothetical protein